MKPYLIDDLLEPDFDGTAVQVLATFGVVDQLAQLPLSHLAGPITEYEKHRIDSVGFPGTVRPDDRGKRLHKETRWFRRG